MGIEYFRSLSETGGFTKHQREFQKVLTEEDWGVVSNDKKYCHLYRGESKSVEQKISMKNIVKSAKYRQKSSTFFTALENSILASSKQKQWSQQLFAGVGNACEEVPFNADFQWFYSLFPQAISCVSGIILPNSFLWQIL